MKNEFTGSELTDYDLETTPSELEQSDSISKALEIHLIFDRIFSYLSYNTISRNCRLVNKIWNQAAIQYLNNWKIFQLFLRDKDPHNLELRVKDRGVKSKCSSFISVDQLQEKLKTQNRKAIWLSLEYKGHLENEHMTKCIDLVLQWLTKLSLDDVRSGHHQSDEKWIPINSLYIKGDASNLEILSLGRIWPEFRHLDSETPSMSVKTLHEIKVIEFKSNYGHSLYDNTRDIIRSIPNVQEILNLPLDYVHALKDLPKAQSKLKSINWQKIPIVADENCIEKLILLSTYKNQLKLKRLKISILKWRDKRKKLCDSIYKKICDILSLLLQVSRESILRLEIWPLDIPNCLEIPQLTKLVTITLVLTDPPRKIDVKQRGFFPANFQLDCTFPNLRKLTIIGFSDKLKVVENLLPLNILLCQGPNCQNLRELKLKNRDNCNVSIQVFEKLISCFPQIQILHLSHHPMWLTSCLPSIWNLLRNVEQLVIETKWTVSDHKNILSNYFLDEAVTGIPKDKCDELREYPDTSSINIETIKQVQTHPGISNMKNLKQLSIIFGGCHSRNFLFSHVSARYGFELLPKLIVNFTIQEITGEQSKAGFKKMLEPIMPFIRFGSDVL